MSRRARGQDVLVAEQVRQRGLARHVGSIRHRRIAQRSGPSGSQLLHQRQERQVEEQQRVLRVIDDVGELPGKQPRIDGVAHGADAGYGVIELEMAIPVPGQRGDAVARLHAQIAQRIGKAGDTGPGFTVGRAMQAALDSGGDDLGAGVHIGRVIEDAGDQQRPVHHHALQHRSGSPWKFARG